MSGTATVPPDTYTIRLTATDGALASATDVQVVVTKEAASLEYTGDLLTSADSTGKGGLSLSATILEEADGLLGIELGTAKVRFDIFASTDLTMSTPLTGCTSAVREESPGNGEAACKVLDLAPDSYTVRASLESTHYAAEEDVVAATVAAATPGSATGGGWLTDPTSDKRSNFGFTVKSSKSKVSGTSLYIYRSTIADRAVKDGLGNYLPAGSYTWIVKSNAMKTYSQQCTTQPACSATFAGKATIKAISRSSGNTFSLGGGFGFEVQARDNGEPGTDTPGDSYTIRISDASSVIYRLGSVQSGVTLGGGNIQIRQPK